MTFSDISKEFSDILNKNLNQKEMHAELENYVNTFPSSKIKFLIKTVPIFFHRQWIRTSVHGHLRFVRKLQKKLLTNKSKENCTQTHAVALAWLEQARKLFETVEFYKQFKPSDIDIYDIPASQLELGDIVLSYKTSYYLKKNPLSMLVRLASNSSITHAMVACHEKDELPTLLVSGDITKGLGILSPTPQSGEIFIILKPITHVALPKVLESIRFLKNQAHKRTLSKSSNDINKFPEIKCQTASFIGFLYIAFSMLGGFTLTLPNPFRNKSGMFCSELIDTIFKQAGILLTPRSENAAVVGPIELLYSPYLTLKGVICNKEDIVQIQKEIRQQYLIE